MPRQSSSSTAGIGDRRPADKALGLTLPETLLATADEMIQ
jgi:hypothetical protein